MGLEDLIKEGEQAMDGQDASNQQAQNQQSGSGNDAKEDTMIDSGKAFEWYLDGGPTLMIFSCSCR
jgi:hypothetical protein